MGLPVIMLRLSTMRGGGLPQDGQVAAESATLCRWFQAPGLAVTAAAAHIWAAFCRHSPRLAKCSVACYFAGRQTSCL